MTREQIKKALERLHNIDTNSAAGARFFKEEREKLMAKKCFQGAMDPRPDNTIHATIYLHRSWWEEKHLRAAISAPEFWRLHRSHSGNVGIDFAIPFDPSRPTSEIEPQVRARVEELQKLFSGISSVWILWPKAELRSRRVRETRWEFYWLPGESSIIYLRDLISAFKDALKPWDVDVLNTPLRKILAADLDEHHRTAVPAWERPLIKTRVNEAYSKLKNTRHEVDRPREVSGVCWLSSTPQELLDNNVEVIYPGMDLVGVFFDADPTDDLVKTGPGILKYGIVDVRTPALGLRKVSARRTVRVAYFTDEEMEASECVR